MQVTYLDSLQSLTSIKFFSNRDRLPKLRHQSQEQMSSFFRVVPRDADSVQTTRCQNFCIFENVVLVCAWKAEKNTNAEVKVGRYLLIDHMLDKLNKKVVIIYYFVAWWQKVAGSIFLCELSIIKKHLVSIIGFGRPSLK